MMTGPPPRGRAKRMGSPRPSDRQVLTYRRSTGGWAGGGVPLVIGENHRFDPPDARVNHGVA